MKRLEKFGVICQGQPFCQDPKTKKLRGTKRSSDIGFLFFDLSFGDYNLDRSCNQLPSRNPGPVSNGKPGVIILIRT
jgi:hypothetical protein